MIFEHWYNSWIEHGPDLDAKDLAEEAWVACKVDITKRLINHPMAEKYLQEVLDGDEDKFKKEIGKILG